MTPTVLTLPIALADSLRIEGSELHILKASSYNLDWTWCVRFTYGDTSQCLREVGEDLQPVLDEIGRRIEAREYRS